MAGRETAEEKARRLIREEIAASQQQAADEKNPGIQTLRRVIREELADLLKGQGGGAKREPAAEDEKAGDDIWTALGIK